MPLDRITGQGQQTLVEFYQVVESTGRGHYGSQGGRSMLSIIGELDEMFPNTQLWALTSHYHLVLLNKNDWKADWLIKIASAGSTYYTIDYLLPEAERPWENARVTGEANSHSTAIDLILISMTKCRGWINSLDLSSQTAARHL